MLENIRLSLQGILSHKVRSILTMLGIIIGIAAIITIVSTIKGTNEQIKNNLIGSGNNTVNVQLYQGESPYDFSYQAAPDGVKVVSAEVRDQITSLKNVESASFYRTRSYCDNVYYQNTQFSGSMYGIDAAYFDTAGYEVQQGRGFLSKEYTNNAKAVILDSTAVKSLYSSESPIGSVIDINGEPFTVVGVVTEVNSFEPVINSEEDYWTYMGTSGGKMFIPGQSWPIAYRYDEPENCLAKAVDTDSMPAVGKKVAELMNATIRTNSVGKEGDSNQIKYDSQDLLKQAKSLQKLSSSTNTMLIWIAGNRTYPRDRAEKGNRCEKGQHSGTVPDRSFCADQHRRNHWCGNRHRSGTADLQDCLGAGGDQFAVHCGFCGIFYGGGHCLWTDPVYQGFESESDRCPAV